MHTLGFFIGFSDSLLCFYRQNKRRGDRVKNMKKLIFIFTLLFLFQTAATDVFAYQKASGSSAKLSPYQEELVPDTRALVLRDYLSRYDSPLATYSGKFVASADRYNLDWRLVAAISGLESGFGIHIPPNSYNGWGWGIYGNNVLYFASWDQAIETISKGLRERYLGDNPDSNPYIIGPTYAASPTWADRVTNFMESIEAFRLNQAKNSLALAL